MARRATSDERRATTAERRATTAERRDVLGVPVAPLTMEQALAEVESAIRERRRLLIGVVNAAKIVHMRRDAVLDQAVRSADVILADGMGVVWAAGLLGRRLPQRVTGIDLMVHMLRRGSELGWRVYCLGATEDVSRTVAARLAADYPGVKLVGRRNGYFSDDESRQVAADIAGAQPDLLLVAMSSPRKEVFLADFAQLMQVPVCHGVGGAFDVLAGQVRRAPQLWQRCGLEWLYRVLQEPGRMWKRYLVTNTLFVAMVVRRMLKTQ
jgi:N-acetylglucosaminyldiphosphoundecaprenol N-acetyl-beta-D-mannosaminyltransferase